MPAAHANNAENASNVVYVIAMARSTIWLKNTKSQNDDNNNNDFNYFTMVTHSAAPVYKGPSKLVQTYTPTCNAIGLFSIKRNNYYKINKEQKFIRQHAGTCWVDRQYEHQGIRITYLESIHCNNMSVHLELQLLSNLVAMLALVTLVVKL